MKFSNGENLTYLDISVKVLDTLASLLWMLGQQLSHCPDLGFLISSKLRNFPT
jgi:hypothetical protein